jgi:hypothetical protein
VHRRRFYRYAVEEELLDHSPAAHARQLHALAVSFSGLVSWRAWEWLSLSRWPPRTIRPPGVLAGMGGMRECQAPGG